MKCAAEYLHPFAFGQLVIDRPRPRTHGSQVRDSTAVVPLDGLRKRPSIRELLAFDEVCNLSDAYVRGDPIRMTLSIDYPEHGTPGVRQQNHPVFAETLPDEIDHLVEIALELPDGHGLAGDLGLV